MSAWIDDARSRQEPASYQMRPKRDLVAEAIQRTKSRIEACFSDVRYRAKLKDTSHAD